MDPFKIMLEAFGKKFGIEQKLLDAIKSPEDFGKFLDEQKGKLFGNPEDIKNLQKIISQKDVDLKKVATDFEKLKTDLKTKKDEDKSELEKKFGELSENFKTLTDQVVKINKDNEIADLKKAYPDILPEVLVGKTDEEKKTIVDSQRAMNKKNYGDSQHFKQPTYSDVSEIEAEIESVKADKSITGEQAAVKVLHLKREKENFVKPEGSESE